MARFTPSPTAIVFLAVLLLLLVRMPGLESFDLWWHLETGEQILAERWVPKTDPFSHTMGGEAWVAHEWGADVIFYGLWRIGGLPALLLLRSALVAGAAAVVFGHLRRRVPHGTALISTIVFVAASHPAWNVRPGAVTLFLAAITMARLETWARPIPEPEIVGPFGIPLSDEEEDRKKANRGLLVLPLIMLLWANLHGGFAFGLGLIGLYALVAWLPALGHPSPDAPKTTGPWPISICLIACAAAACINPHGPALLLFPLEFFTDPHDFILEWAPTSVEHTPFLLPMLIGLVLVLGFSPERPPTRRLLVLAILIALGLKSIRHLPYLGLGIALLAAEPIGHAVARLDWFLVHYRGLPQGDEPAFDAAVEPDAGRQWWGWIVPTLLAVGIGAGFVSKPGEEIFGPRYAKTEYPEAAAAWIKETHPAGKMFNHYDWGGYLISRLHPTHPVFIDGRADLYRPRFVREVFLPILEARPGWDEQLTARGVGYIVIPPEVPLADAAEAHPGWTRRHRDDVAVIFARKPKPTREGERGDEQ